MKHISLILILLLSLSPAFGQLRDTDYNWYYIKGNSNDSFTSIWYKEYWTIRGTEEVNGKTYNKLYVNEVSYGVKPAFGVLPHEDLLETHVLDIREEEGRVYALKEMYVEYVKHHVWNDNYNVYLAETEDKQEVLLYDYTLGEGATYPSMDSPTVERTDSIQLQNSEKRKVLWLSNGCIIVEGIGCVYSFGNLVCYQNQPVKEDGSALVSYLELYQEEKDTPLFLCKNYKSIFPSSVHIAADFKLSGDAPSLFDLSGRRFSTPPAKGFFIQGGKKVVR